MASKNYWLMKSEPDVFSIDDLMYDKTTLWEGVRNYQARNYMMNDMKKGDLALLYHSNATPPGVAGVMEISQTAAPDKLQFDKKSEYFDPKATPEKPRWFCVECKYVKKLSTFITLEAMKNNEKLKDMFVLKKGNRLSITPITEAEFKVLTET